MLKSKNVRARERATTHHGSGPTGGTPVVRPSHNWRDGERCARRWIEDQGLEVHDANIIFRQNCANIDLVVYGKHGAIYVQVKSSSRAAGPDHVVVDGSPWTEAQLFEGGAIFNKHDHFVAKLVVLVDVKKDGVVAFYVAPPAELEPILRAAGTANAEKPKRDGTRRSVRFRKELPRSELSRWLNAHELFGEPPSAGEPRQG